MTKHFNWKRPFAMSYYGSTDGHKLTCQCVKRFCPKEGPDAAGSMSLLWSTTHHPSLGSRGHDAAVLAPITEAERELLSQWLLLPLLLY